MTDPNAFDMVKEFLDTHYRDEPSDVRASISAMEKINGSLEHGDRIARAFRALLSADLPAGTLRDLVMNHAGRFAEDDPEARQFLESVYTTCVLDCLG